MCILHCEFHLGNTWLWCCLVLRPSCYLASVQSPGVSVRPSRYTSTRSAVVGGIATVGLEKVGLLTELRPRGDDPSGRIQSPHTIVNPLSQSTTPLPRAPANLRISIIPCLRGRTVPALVFVRARIDCARASSGAEEVAVLGVLVRLIPLRICRI